MRISSILGVCVWALLVPVSQAAASRIPVAAVSTTMGSGFGTSLINTVNGVGLSALTLTATHASTIPPNSWVSAAGILAGVVQFDLGAPVSLSGFSFWNQNAGGPGAAGSTGIQGVSILVSLDGITFVPLPGAPTTFARVMGFGPVGPQMFSFTPVLARQIRFTILTNYGDLGQTGFAEVGFDGVPAAAVPEPATLALIGSGLAYGLARRRARTRR